MLTYNKDPWSSNQVEQEVVIGNLQLLKEVKEKLKEYFDKKKERKKNTSNFHSKFQWVYNNLFVECIKTPINVI